jgi:hypothetical protein
MTDIKNQPNRRSVLKYLAYSAAAAGTTFVPRSVGAFFPGHIRKDVCILGGGAAGIFSALKLRDRGFSVAVIEQTGRIGGHSETFRDPDTGVMINIGVQIFPNHPLVVNTYGRYGLSLQPAPSGGGQPPLLVDFATGQLVKPITSTPAEFGQALVKYINILTKEYPFIGTNGINLPNPVPAELLLPFKDFLEARGLLPGLARLFDFLQGFGSPLDMTTLYALKNIDLAVSSAILTNGFLRGEGGNDLFYKEAEKELGNSIFKNTNVLSVSRPTAGPVRVYINTPSGRQLILCDRLIVTFPPLLQNMQRLDLSRREFDIFRRFRSNFYWTSVAEISGLPPFQRVSNRSASLPFNVPRLPGLYGVSPSSAPNVYNILYGSDRVIPGRAVQQQIERDVERLSVATGSPVTFNRFRLFKGHNPYALYVSPQDIQNGFYARLKALQGQRNTFYLGSAFQTHSTLAVWSQAEELLNTFT